MWATVRLTQKDHGTVTPQPSPLPAGCSRAERSLVLALHYLSAEQGRVSSLDSIVTGTPRTPPSSHVASPRRRITALVGRGHLGLGLIDRTPRRRPPRSRWPTPATTPPPPAPTRWRSPRTRSSACFCFYRSLGFISLLRFASSALLAVLCFDLVMFSAPAAAIGY